MAETYVAVIKGPKELLPGGIRFEKFEITDEEIEEYIEDSSYPVEDGEAVSYYKSEYIAGWEQRFCNVLLLTEEEFNDLYGEMGEVLKEEAEDEDPLDEWEEEEPEEDILEYKKFSLSKKEFDKYDEWRKSKGEVYVGAVGGAYEFCFTPTGIGTIVVVKCADGTQLDLTDYDLF